MFLNHCRLGEHDNKTAWGKTHVFKKVLVNISANREGMTYILMRYWNRKEHRTIFGKNVCVLLFYSAYTHAQTHSTNKRFFKFKIAAIHASRGRYIFIHWQFAICYAQTQIDACARAAHKLDRRNQNIFDHFTCFDDYSKSPFNINFTTTTVTSIDKDAKIRIKRISKVNKRCNKNNNKKNRALWSL